MQQTANTITGSYTATETLTSAGYGEESSSNQTLLVCTTRDDTQSGTTSREGNSITGAYSYQGTTDYTTVNTETNQSLTVEAHLSTSGKLA